MNKTLNIQESILVQENVSGNLWTNIVYWIKLIVNIILHKLVTYLLYKICNLLDKKKV